MKPIEKFQYWWLTTQSYRAKQHDKKTARFGYLIIAFIIAFVALSFVGCKTVQPLTQTRDSVRVEIRHDSVYVFKHDSIFRDRWRSGDTVFVTLTKFQTLYRDKLVEVHDTIATTQTEQVPVEVVPTYYKNTSRGFWVLLVILLLIVGWKVAKLYFKIQSGGIL